MSEAGAVNGGQRSGWDGDGGAFWAAHADRFDAEVAGYREALLATARIAAHDAVLDIGCGNGRITLDAAVRARAGSALGIDLSAAMLAVARERAERERVPNVGFVQADAQTHPFPPAAFDVAVSRNGAMFFEDPVAAFRNIARALRPGGRLVLLAWQPFERNEWLTAVFAALFTGGPVTPFPPDGPGPFGLSDPERVRAVLGAAGYADVRLTGITAPVWLGADPEDAVRFLAGQRAAQLGELDPVGRAVALDALRASLADHHTEQGVRYSSAAWLIEARHGEPVRQPR
jgi:SAM-dependent methyltransferase